MSSSDNIVQSSEFMLFGVRVKVDPMRKSVSLNNLSHYEIPIHNAAAAAGDSPAAAADGVYASADDAIHVSGTRQRKRGVPWTEEEHKFFLLGLQKVGKGDWRNISRNFVKTRTPTQVASHAQKYFLRRTNLNRRRRRSSLFDITTESVTAIPMEQEVPQEDLSPAQLPLAENSIISGPQVDPVPQIENSIEKFTYKHLVHSSYYDSAEIAQQAQVFSVPTQARMVGLNLNQRLSEDPSPLSLNLSLSIDQVNDQFSRYSAFEVKSSFNNGDSMISVA